MSRPWMPLYVADYLRDTQRLTTAEHGAYLLLIMEYWTNGVLPNDDRQLARISRMTASQWRTAKPTIQAFFHEGWRHKRIDAELQRTSDVSETYAARARQAANKRWSKHAQGNASSTPQAMPDECLGMPISQSQSQKKEDTANAVPPSPVHYAFESGVIRLTQKDFDQWQRSFTHLDLGAELLALTEWSAQQPKWFFAVSGALAKRNREAKAAAERPAEPQSQFRWNGIEGVV